MSGAPEKKSRPKPSNEKKPARKAVESPKGKGKGVGKKAGEKPLLSREDASTRKPGRPTKRTPEVEARILEGLSEGTPLTIICQPNDMPTDRCVRLWADEDEAFSSDIARAREAGFDRIAMDILRIADNVDEHAQSDTIETPFGQIPNKEWILRSKLRVEARFKLLSKWDPKRYGDKVTQEISGPDGKPLVTRTEMEITPEMETRLIEAARAAAELQPPGCMLEPGEPKEDAGDSA